MLPQTSDGFLIIGHRGAAGLAPENTLASFALAVALGVDGIELDVRMSGTEVVVIHDKTVDRTTNGRGLVAELGFAPLRRLDAGDGERIPTLVEVLEAVPRHVLVNIELKGSETAEPVARIVDGRAGDAREVGRLLASSFNHDELMRFHERCPAVACAPLSANWSGSLESMANAFGAWAVNLADRIATPSRVAQVKAWGCRCLVYTVNDPVRARELRALGVDGVFTDFPDRVRRPQRR